jgi:selenocysteine lyase/cysteine desulfurase
VAELFGSKHPENVMFTVNTTTALNTVIKGLLHPGNHVLLSDMEHNATFRPIYKMAQEGLVSYDVFPTFPNDPNATPSDVCRGIEALIKPQTRMLVCAHASNICSAVLPLAEVGTLCRRRGILFVVDAAQSAGHIPIDMERMQIDALCAPGHKGLLGPQGVGFFLLRSGLVADTLTEGGSGYHSLDGNMPQEAPERYEAGTLPTPAIVGLCEGIRAVRRYGVEAIGQYERELNAYLQELLSMMPRVRIYTPHLIGATLLFNADGIPPDALAAELDKRGFCVRAGYHCAPLAHKTLGTPDGGAVRVSPSVFNTETEINLFADALRELLN